MPLPTEIGLLSTRVDSYRQPIDTQTTPFQPPKRLVLPPVATAQNRPRSDRLSTGVDGYRQGSTGVIGLKTDIFSAAFAMIWETL